jgi:tetratricopeptide (TPR) repeat protein
VGLFDESLRSYEDWDMWLRLAKAGCEMGWVPKPISLYRFHSAQMTRDGTQMTTATFAVLDKTFSDPSIPDEWKEMEDEAYCNAYLRSAAQAYHAKDYQNAEASLEEALSRNPTLLDDAARALANQFVAWTELPKVAEPLSFLEDIYQNLPDSLNMLKSRANKELGNVSIQLAFKAYQNRNMADSRYYLRKAIGWDPSWLKNRGVISIFLRSFLPHNS